MGLPALIEDTETSGENAFDIRKMGKPALTQSIPFRESLSNRLKRNLTALVVDAINKKFTTEHLTQKDVGDILGINQPSVSMFLCSKRNASLDRLVEFIDKLDIDLTVMATLSESHENFPVVRQVYPVLRMK